MIYCISDLHGCYDKFMALLDKINFNPPSDTLFILGDVVDRGDKSIECLKYVMATKSVHLIMGNHEQMMLDYYDRKDLWGDWNRNGSRLTKKQFGSLDHNERDKILSYLRSRPYYKTIKVNEKRYFLSHSGLDTSLPFKHQPIDVLIWSREEFYEHKALDKYICIFGHTPTPYISGSTDCSVWFDSNHNDKICIDCGCVYGGTLAALRLDDSEVFYAD